MELELRVLPESPVSSDGGVFQTHRIEAYQGNTRVGYLDVTCILETTNPRHRQIPLLFDNAGNARMYQTSLHVTTARYGSTSPVRPTPSDEEEAIFDEVVTIGSALVRAGQSFCKDSFGKNMVALEAFQGETGDLVWSALLHGRDRKGFVIKEPYAGNLSLMSYSSHN